VSEFDVKCPRCGWVNAHKLDCLILRRFAREFLQAIKARAEKPTT